MKLSRRNILLATGIGALAKIGGAIRPARAQAPAASMPLPNGYPYVPVTTLNGRSLPYVMKDGVKEFHLIAEEIEHEFAPGCKAKCWGYNGSTPGPTIEAVEGDRIRLIVTNRLP